MEPPIRSPTPTQTPLTRLAGQVVTMLAQFGGGPKHMVPKPEPVEPSHGAFDIIAAVHYPNREFVVKVRRRPPVDAAPSLRPPPRAHCGCAYGCSSCVPSGSTPLSKARHLPTPSASALALFHARCQRRQAAQQSSYYRCGPERRETRRGRDLVEGASLALAWHGLLGTRMEWFSPCCGRIGDIGRACGRECQRQRNVRL